MVEIECTEGKLVLHVKGLDKVLALKSSVEVDLSHVKSVAEGIEESSWVELQDSLRVGTNVGGVVAGSFRHHGEWVFWDIHRREKAITIDVEHERFKKIIVEVADPRAVVELIRKSLPH